VLLEAVPNLSVGPEDEALDALRAAVDRACGPGAARLDVHTDPDHARTVLTLAGAPAPLVRVLGALVDAAEEHASLDGHEGVHPRVGLIDVVPIARLGGAREADARRAVRQVAADLARTGVPSLFFGRAAPRPEHEALHGIRRRFQAPPLGEPLPVAPDAGPATGHPRLGCTCVGVRDPLVAYNVLLDTRELDLGRRIARQLRPADGGLPGVQALAFPLADREDRVQVSTNLTDVDATTTADVYRAVRERATEAGVDVLGGELVGLAPERALPTDPAAMGLDEAPRPLEDQLADRGFDVEVP